MRWRLLGRISQASSFDFLPRDERASAPRGGIAYRSCLLPCLERRQISDTVNHVACDSVNINDKESVVRSSRDTDVRGNARKSARILSGSLVAPQRGPIIVLFASRSPFLCDFFVPTGTGKLVQPNAAYSSAAASLG